ncbi:MAG: tetratricopeptide repeat protein [Candidatus Riflebacteria bacterium]|nr:tetratricopeptide repeat protein [Candidatus Riflebacteria bacterium]
MAPRRFGGVPDRCYNALDEEDPVGARRSPEAIDPVTRTQVVHAVSRRVAAGAVGVATLLILCTGSPSDRLFAHLAVGAGQRGGPLELPARRPSTPAEIGRGSAPRPTAATGIAWLHRRDPRLVPLVFGLLGLATLTLGFLSVRRARADASPGPGAWWSDLVVWTLLLGFTGSRFMLHDPAAVFDLLAVALLLALARVTGRPAAWLGAVAVLAVWPMLARHVGFGLVLVLAATVGVAIAGNRRGRAAPAGMAVLALGLAVLVTALEAHWTGGSPADPCREGWAWLTLGPRGLDPLDAPPDLGAPEGRVLAALVLSTASALVLSPRVDAVLLVPWLALTVLGLCYRRFAVELAVASLALLGPALDEVALRLAGLRERLGSADQTGRRIVSSLLVPVRAVGVVLAVAALIACPWRPGARFLDDPLAAPHPARGAFGHLRQAAPGESVLVWFGWSGRALPELGPAVRPFIEPSETFHEPDLVERYRAMVELWPGYDRIMDRSRIGLVLAPRRVALVQVLALSPRWTTVHEDRSSVVLRRIDPDARSGPLAAAPSLPRSTPIGQSVREALEALDRGNCHRAVYHASAAIQGAPADPALRVILGRILLAFGRDDEARRCLREALALPGGSRFREEIDGLLGVPYGQRGAGR